MRLRRAASVCALWLAAGGAVSAQTADSSLAGLHQRAGQLLTTLQPQYGDLGAKVAAYAAVGYTALHGCPTRSQLDRFLAQPTKAPTEMFARPPLIRYLFQFGDCLAPDQRQAIIRAELDPSQLFGHGTLNHAAMTSTSYYLLAERYPDLPWVDGKGQHLTSADVVSRYKALLMGRFRKFMADGYNEQLSPTYSINNIFPLLNLVDFAQDPELRAAAEQVLVAEIAILRVDSLDGAVMPPLERENPPFQLTSDGTTNVRDLLWFYYGDFPLTGEKRIEPPYGTMLAVSPWRPPHALLALKSPADLPYEVKIDTPEFGIWDAPTPLKAAGSAWIDRDFAVGAGNFYVDPAGYNSGSVAFRILLRGVKPVGAVECYQPYWHGDEGEDAWDSDRSSPFQYSWSLGPRGILMYDIPAADPYVFGPKNSFFQLRARTAGHLNQVAECRLPARADEMQADSRGVFARYGAVMVALVPLGPSPAQIDRAPASPKLKGFMTLKVHAPRTAFYYEAEPASVAGSLARFQAHVAATLPTYDPRTDSARAPSLSAQPIRFGDRSRDMAPGVVVRSPIFNWAQSQLSMRDR